jgi:hypothetical protein
MSESEMGRVQRVHGRGESEGDDMTTTVTEPACDGPSTLGHMGRHVQGKRWITGAARTHMHLRLRYGGVLR